MVIVARSPSLVCAALVLASLALVVVQCTGATVQVDDAGCVSTWYPNIAGYYGGGGGSPFSDLVNPYPCGQYYPTSIAFDSGYYLDSFTAHYNPTGVSPGQHGGGGGNGYNLVLAQGEYINQVTIYAGSIIDRLEITSTLGKMYGFGDNHSGSPIVWTSNFQANEYLAYFEGRAGQYVDALRIVTFRVTA